MKEQALFIDGQWIDHIDGRTFDIINPSTQEVLASIPSAGKKEADLAIEAADRALEGWSALTAYERADYLIRLEQLLLDEKENMAKIISSEMGKAYIEAVGEVHYAASYLRWYAEEAKRIYGETIPASSASKRLMVIKQPIGVVAAITPWNFPIGMLTRKVGPALAAGCTCIVKPAKQGVLTALAFAKMVETVGIPNGVVNVVAGSTSEISKAIFDSPIVRKVSFTGSTEIGKELVVQSAKTLKKLSLELGGHAPFIVLEDADLDRAAEGALLSKFRNSGQTCVCTNRIYVQESVKEAFTARLVEKTKQLKMGHSLSEEVDIGPLVSRESVEKVYSQVQDAVEKGAKVEVGGNLDVSTGFFFEPTVLSDVTEDMLVMQEETFGPLAPISGFTHLDDVIAIANSTNYGLAAYVYTSNIDKATYVTEKLQFGIIGLNDPMPSAAQAPFGGIKESGFGREGGRQGIQDYLEEKYISMETKPL